MFKQNYPILLQKNEFTFDEYFLYQVSHILKLKRKIKKHQYMSILKINFFNIQKLQQKNYNQQHPPQTMAINKMDSE